MFKEFRDFALKGNVIDLAVGVVMATTFSSTIKSALNDVLIPTLDLIAGNPNFVDFKIGDQIRIGRFVNEFLNFLIIAFALFMIITAINKAIGAKMNNGEGDEAMKEGLKESLKEATE